MDGLRERIGIGYGFHRSDVGQALANEGLFIRDMACSPC